MGKSLPSLSKLEQFTKMATPTLKSQKPLPSSNRTFKPETSKSSNGKLKVESTSSSSSPSSTVKNQDRTPVPLSEVVADCVKRWFADTLKEAKGGDITMQVLVGQMYHSGYGTPKDPQKAKAWITKASRARSSALKVIYKRPGYNVSDSDSESDSDGLQDVANEIK